MDARIARGNGPWGPEGSRARGRPRTSKRSGSRKARDVVSAREAEDEQRSAHYRAQAVEILADIDIKGRKFMDAAVAKLRASGEIPEPEALAKAMRPHGDLVFGPRCGCGHCEILRRRETQPGARDTRSASRGKTARAASGCAKRPLRTRPNCCTRSGGPWHSMAT